MIHYVGHTPDVKRRVYEHNNPQCQKYTAKHLPWTLSLCFPVSEQRGDAMKVESFIKRQKSRKFIHRLIAENGNADFYKKLCKDVLARSVG